MPPELNHALATRVIERLGIDTVKRDDFEALRAFYGAWCERVPFDNAAKLIALRTGARGHLPGIDVNQFFTNYLEHGIGATCWPSSNALYSLARAIGFDAQRLAGSMRDTGVISHGSAKVNLNGENWLIDSSMLTVEPVRIPDSGFIIGDSLQRPEIEAIDGTHIVWWDATPSAVHIPCRLIAGEVSEEFYLQRYEASREKSPFNDRIYLRRTTPDQVLVITGNRRFVKTADGLEASLLTEDELMQNLSREGGFSAKIIDALCDCGAISASMIPAEGPFNPPIDRRPSRRATLFDQESP